MKKSKFVQVLAAAVASGSSVKDAAAVAGCAESTAYSVSCTAEFRAEVTRLKTAAVDNAVCVLTANAAAASQALVKLLSSDDEKIVLAAAGKLLAVIGPLQELAELRVRIEQLEQSRAAA
ncbi:MAG: hypothetical protein KF752_03180 [Pirellulaceae bacterium]|nr:hypothetical protein [Pirellulaceae bacterium]